MEFSFFIGGYFGNHVECIIRGGKLHCYIMDMSWMKRFVTPTIIPIKNNPDWKALTAFLKAAKWQKEYFNRYVMDGTQWELKFKDKDIKLRCNGSNAYPDNFEAFLRLLNAVTSKYGVAKIG